MVSLCRRARRRFCKSVPRDLAASTRVVMACQFMAYPTLLPLFLYFISRLLLLLDQSRHHVIYGDGSNRTTLAIGDREHAQIVFIEQLKHIPFIGIAGNAE